MNLIAQTEKIWTIPAFFSSDTCDQLILTGEHRGFKEADVGLPGGAKMMKTIRDNSRSRLEDKDFTAKVWQKLAPLLPMMRDQGIPVGLNDHMRFY